MSAGAANKMREKIQQKITQKLQQCSEYQLYLILKDTTILEIIPPLGHFSFIIKPALTVVLVLGLSLV